MVTICGDAHLILVDGRRSGYAVEQRPEGTRIRRAIVAGEPPVPILSRLLPRDRYALGWPEDYHDLTATLEAYFRHGDLVKYSGRWYRAMMSVGPWSFADVVELTGLPIADVFDMVYSVELDA